MSNFKRMIQTHIYQKDPYINKYELITWDDFLLENLARPYQLSLLEKPSESVHASTCAIIPLRRS